VHHARRGREETAIGESRTKSQPNISEVRLASRILAAAAKGERDPVQSRIAALLEIEDDQEYDLDRCYLQVMRLRKQVAQAEANAAK
jgi:hypothetical protein